MILDIDLFNLGHCYRADAALFFEIDAITIERRKGNVIGFTGDAHRQVAVLLLQLIDHLPVRFRARQIMVGGTSHHTDHHQHGQDI